MIHVLLETLGLLGSSARYLSIVSKVLERLVLTCLRPLALALALPLAPL